MADNSKIDLVLIDDQIAILALMKASLAALGYRKLEGARSGSEGLELIRRIRPHAVICDINMPGMNGLEVLKEVRTGKAGVPESLPFIFLTGHSESAVVQVAMALDVNGFIRKPVAPKEVDQRLQRIINRQYALQDRQAYASVVIPDVHLSGVTMPPPSAKLSDEGVEKAIKDLVDGDVLAAGIQTIQGLTLVKAGAAVTSDMRDRLNDLVDIGIVKPTTKITA